jgi:hypothetical protein
MHMRRYLVAAAVTLTALALPTAASAKGAAGLTISSGGRTWDADRLAMEIAEQSHFYEALWEPGVNALTSTPPRNLGPRLVLAWDMDHDGSAPGPDTPFIQWLYPFALGGPLVHTPDGQEVYLEPVDGGWHRAERRLLATLRQLGALPRLTARVSWNAV